MVSAFGKFGLKSLVPHFRLVRTNFREAAAEEKEQERQQGKETARLGAQG